MLVDHIFMTGVAIVFSLPLFIYVFSDPLNNDIYQTETYKNLMYLPMFGMSLYFCKDCINGQSFAKRRLGFVVVDNDTNQVASPMKCFIRDIFCIIFPIEVLVAWTNTSRRIGDLVAGTKLVKVTDSNIKSNPLKIGQVILCVILSFVIYATLYSLLDRL